MGCKPITPRSHQSPSSPDITLHHSCRRTRDGWVCYETAPSSSLIYISIDPIMACHFHCMCEYWPQRWTFSINKQINPCTWDELCRWSGDETVRFWSNKSNHAEHLEQLQRLLIKWIHIESANCTYFLNNVS